MKLLNCVLSQMERFIWFSVRFHAGFSYWAESSFNVHSHTHTHTHSHTGLWYDRPIILAGLWFMAMAVALIWHTLGLHISCWSPWNKRSISPVIIQWCPSDSAALSPKATGTVQLPRQPTNIIISTRVKLHNKCTIEQVLSTSIIDPRKAAQSL